MPVTRSPFFLSAVIFVGGALSFRFDDSSVTWLWAGRPQIGAVLLCCSVTLTILLVRSTRRASREQS